MDRRTFVKTSAKVAGAAAITAAAASAAVPLLRSRQTDSSGWMYAAHRRGGPGFLGTPYVPLVVQDGAFHADLAPFEHKGERFEPARWHAYCGAADLPSDVLLPLVYWREPEVLAHIRPWYADRLGEPVRPEHFEDVGFGASTVLGSVDEPLLRVTVVRWTPDSYERIEAPIGSTTTGEPARALPLRLDEMEVVRTRLLHEGFAAVGSACTHFCCTAGFREAETLSRARDAWDHLFCACHNTHFDLRQPVRYVRAGPVSG